VWLVIAEKPSVAMDIARALGRPERKDGYVVSGNYVVTWATGHMLEIDEGIAPRRWRLEDLPVFPREFRYVPIKGKERQLGVISKLLEKAEVVVNCGDAGREGELIIREILRYSGYVGKTLRLWTSEALTKDVVLREFKRLRPSQDFDDLYYSALARQHGDWIVGINLSRLVTLKANNGEVWSVGRVQTPTLALVVKRDLEIESFKPETYYVVLAGFRKDKEFQGILLRNGEEAKLSKEEALKLESSLAKIRRGVVKEVQRERKEEPPPLLHSLTSLQREANVLYGLSAKRTLDIAQSLYEEWKIISYPRTDARHMGDNNRGLVKEVLRKLGREDLVPRVDLVGKRVFDSSKLTDHHAIIPLDRPPDGLPQTHRRIYDLIYRKFVGAFMEDYVYETQRVKIGLGSETFLSEGRRDVYLGWASLYPRKEAPLPELRQGEEVEKLWVRAEERKTKPPPRYTEATLLKEMERLSLGTPATRASIIETLLERGYMMRTSKSLVSTTKGRELVHKLSGSKVISPEMTSEWERTLEEIYTKRKGLRGYEEFVEGIKRFTLQEIDKLKDVQFQVGRTASREMLNYARRISRDLGVRLPGTDLDTVRRFLDEHAQKAKISCKCGGNVVGFSKGWRCKSCGAIVWREIAGKRITFRQAKALFEGKEVKAKGFKSRSGRKFSAVIYLEDGKVKFKFNTNVGPIRGDGKG